MKVAITATGPTPLSDVDPRFARAPYFIFVDTDTGEITPAQNPITSMTSGAGPAAVQFLQEQGIQVIVTGSIGPNAQEALLQSGINVITGIAGKIQDVINNLPNILKQSPTPPPPTSSPPPAPPSGYGPFGGSGPGMGGGRGGMGRGRRRGKGRGKGRGRGAGWIQ